MKQYKTEPRYRIDQVTRQPGHTVLRLPPYHYDLNPVELIWAQLKGYVAANNATFKLPAVQQLAEDDFKTNTVGRWRSFCGHVKKIEAEYWARDNLCEYEIEKRSWLIFGKSRQAKKKTEHEICCHVILNEIIFNENQE